MRPERFQDWLIGTVKNTPGVTRGQSCAEAGEAKAPSGIVHEERPVTDTPFAAPAPQPGEAADVWLAGAIGAAECSEIARVERWAALPEGASQAGLTVFHHNGSRNFVRPLQP
ncbi:hypothetical protein [Streptomyces sp. AM6-12]|uniref:hypothetical protein n=1 Tax=Streptomyces sp. AM6-12 TaxID=3345149 RepID=UPI0037AD32C1